MNIWFVSTMCESPVIYLLLCVGIDVDVFQTHVLMYLEDVDLEHKIKIRQLMDICV